MIGDEPDDATPLHPDEREGLIPTHVLSRGDLNAVEQANITAALLALRRRRLSTEQVLDDAFVRGLHQLMFGRVWRWAGLYRTTERNIGIDPMRIAVSVRALMGDAAFWVAPEVDWLTTDEAACRLHHRLVAIHPFANGNGRHARAFSDLLRRSLGRPMFSWGAGVRLTDAGPDRRAYIEALRRADRNPDDVGPLVAFARS